MASWKTILTDKEVDALAAMGELNAASLAAALRDSWPWWKKYGPELVEFTSSLDTSFKPLPKKSKASKRVREEDSLADSEPARKKAKEDPDDIVTSFFTHNGITFGWQSLCQEGFLDPLAGCPAGLEGYSGTIKFEAVEFTRFDEWGKPLASVPTRPKKGIENATVVARLRAKAVSSKVLKALPSKARKRQPLSPQKIPQGSQSIALIGSSSSGNPETPAASTSSVSGRELRPRPRVRPVPIPRRI